MKKKEQQMSDKSTKVDLNLVLQITITLFFIATSTAVFGGVIGAAIGGVAGGVLGAMVSLFKTKMAKALYAVCCLAACFVVLYIGKNDSAKEQVKEEISLFGTWETEDSNARVRVQINRDSTCKMSIDPPELSFLYDTAPYQVIFYRYGIDLVSSTGEDTVFWYIDTLTASQLKVSDDENEAFMVLTRVE